MLPSDRTTGADAATIRAIRSRVAELRAQLRQLPPDLRAQRLGYASDALIADTVRIDTPRGSLAFVVVGKGAASRAVSLLTKQPATIAWIDRFAPNSVLWDVGANVGCYSLYAALRPDIRVVAIEPAAINFYLLAANCEVNGMSERVTCLSLGVGSAPAIDALRISQFHAATSFSFRDREHAPQPNRQAALVLPIDTLVETYGLPCPNYLKIDVPGMTGQVITGATRTLLRPHVRELHVEVSATSRGGRRLVPRLAEMGFTAAEHDPHGATTDTTFVRTA